MSETESTEAPDTTGTTDETESTDTDETESTDTDETESTDTAETESTDTAETESTDTAASEEESSGPDPRLLEELDEHIRGARAAAEDALGDAEHSFVESGDDRAEAEDDQTIAPPG